MEENVIRVTEEKMCYNALLNQITDYMLGNVSLDDSPSLITCEKWFGVMEDKALAIRNSVAILMEDATDDTKQRVKEELQ
jgi:hypothetical protein